MNREHRDQAAIQAELTRLRHELRMNDPSTEGMPGPGTLRYYLSLKWQIARLEESDQ